jgi:glycosyltransferase involved in cell wall biosynthesis
VRIAFLSSTPANPLEGSGTFTAIDGLLAGLRRLGHEPVLRPLRFRTGFHTLDRWLYNAGVALAPPAADVVAGIDLDGFLWARRRRRPFVVCLKGVIADELTNERGWVRALLTVQARWERANVHRADRVVVPSRYSAGVAAAAYDLDPERIVVVPEPIDLDAWRRRFRAAARPAARRPRVLAVARMYPRKRIEDLLAAAALLRVRIPDLEVRIVGAGPESARLRARHAELGLGSTVTFLGEVSAEALAVEYVGADCFCLPSVQEGFGLAFAEAMAAGLPVVSCRVAAVPEIVADGRTGLLVSPRRPDELASALETFLIDEGLRKDYGEEGRRRVEAFDAVRVARRFVEALPA